MKSDKSEALIGMGALYLTTIGMKQPDEYVDGRPVEHLDDIQSTSSSE